MCCLGQRRVSCMRRNRQMQARTAQLVSCHPTGQLKSGAHGHDTGKSDKQSASDNNLLVAMKYEVWAKSLVAVVAVSVSTAASEHREWVTRSRPPHQGSQPPGKEKTTLLEQCITYLGTPLTQRPCTQPLTQALLPHPTPNLTSRSVQHTAPTC